MLKDFMDDVIDAAMDQPRPTKQLQEALQTLLTKVQHPMRDRSRDMPQPFQSLSR